MNTQPREPATHRCFREEELLELALGKLTKAVALSRLAEVERCSDCTIVLSAAASAVADETHYPEPAASSSRAELALAAGELLAGRYRIVRAIGAGGMGEVYEALDEELGERLALKTIRSDLAQRAQGLERFKQEIRLARRVVHVNVCRVLEFGRHDHARGATYFLTMELVSGESLGRRLRRVGAFSVQESLGVAHDLCAGLSAIHAQGILHRDIKTHNVMLSANDGDKAAAGRSERALLLDFGIARAIDSRAAPLTTGGVAGTPDYMAPEQLKGETLSPAVDLYALGVVLFELLTGRLPFPSEGSMAGVFKRLEAPPSPPSVWMPAIPSAVDELTVWCLQPRPEHRPHSAEVLRAAIADIQAGKPVALPGIPQGMRAGSSQETGPAQALPSKSGRRSRSGIAIAALVLMAVALAWVARATVSAPDPRASSTAGSPAAASPAAHAAEAASERGSAPAGPASHELSTPVGDERAMPHAGLSASHAVGPGGAKAGKKALPAGPAKAAPLTPSASCTPPYYYDERGLRVYRKDCL